MKKIIFAIAIVMMIGFTASAQRGSDGFFRNTFNDYEDRDGDDNNDLPFIVMPGDSSFGDTDNQSGAPLGSGLLVLTALGAGYAVARRRK